MARVERHGRFWWLVGILVGTAACGDDPSAFPVPDDAGTALDASRPLDAGAPDADRGRPIPRDAGSLRAVDVAGSWCEVGEPLWAELGTTGELRSWTWEGGAWFGRWWIDGDGVAFRWEAHIAMDNTGERLPGDVVVAPARRDGDRLVIGDREYVACSGVEALDLSQVVDAAVSGEDGGV